MIETFVAENFVKNVIKDSLLYHLDVLQVYRSLLWDYRFTESRLSFSLEESIRTYVLEEIPLFRTKAATCLPRAYVDMLNLRCEELEKDYWMFFYENSLQWGLA